MGYCRICEESVDDQYMIKSGYYCKTCYKKKYHSGPKKVRKNEWEPPTYNNQMPDKPGEFYNDQQRKYVYDILRAIGWTKSHKGYWYDNKLRDKDGNWLIEFEQPSPMKSKNYKPSKYFVWLKKYNKPIPKVRYHSREPYFTDEIIDIIQEQYFVDNLTIEYLAYKYECDKREIAWIVHRTYKVIKHMMANEKFKT